MTSGFRIFKDPDVGELVDAVKDAEARRFPASPGDPRDSIVMSPKNASDRAGGARRGEAPRDEG